MDKNNRVGKGIFVGVFFFVFALKSFGSDCGKLQESLKKSISYEVTQNSLMKIDQAKLVVMGERHYSHYFWKMPHIYRFLKKRNKSINCLFSEIAQDATEKQIQEVIDGKKNEVFLTTRRLSFGPLYESIFSVGDNVVLVDVPMKEKAVGPEETFAEWLTRRDSWMLSRIEEAFVNNECQSGLYNIGQGHILNTLESGDSYTSFGERVKNKFKNAVVVQQVYDERLKECRQEIPSFIAPSTDPEIRKILNLDMSKSSSDYVLFLRETDVMHALTVKE